MAKKNREFLNWITELPCIACHSKGTIHDDGNYHTVPAHLKSRGAGGDDVGNVVPLCWNDHVIQHSIGWKEFEKRMGINAKELALLCGELWECTRGN